MWTLCVWGVSALWAASPTEWGRLESGALVGVRSDPSLALVHIEVRYRLEPQSWEQPGLAHLVEHLAFRASGGLADGEYDLRVDALGGDSNGWTRHDWMTLRLTVPPEALGEGLSLEVGRIGSLTTNLTPGILQTELDVIAEEVHFRLQSVGFVDTQAIRSRMYSEAHPYRQPIMGAPAAQSWSVDEVREFETRWLRPEMAQLWIVAPHSVEDVWASLGEVAVVSEHSDGSEWPESLPAAGLGEEERWVWTESRAERAFYMVWPLNIQGHGDLPALEMAAAILALGPGSVAERALWRGARGPRKITYRLERLEHSAELYLAIHDSPRTSRQGLRRVDRELRRIRHSGPSLGEVERARAWLTSLDSERCERPEVQVDAMVDEARGRQPSCGSAWTQALEAVQPEDVQVAAQRWLSEERLILAVVPAGEHDRVPRGSQDVVRP